jgi:hypothetical protein
MSMSKKNKDESSDKYDEEMSLFVCWLGKFMKKDYDARRKNHHLKEYKKEDITSVKAMIT